MFKLMTGRVTFFELELVEDHFASWHRDICYYRDFNCSKLNGIKALRNKLLGNAKSGLFGWKVHFCVKF